MQPVEKNTFFYLRILLCVSLVAIWSLWLINLPEEKKRTREPENRRTEKLENRRTREPDTLSKPHLWQENQRIGKLEKQKVKASIADIKLPNLVNLIPQVENETEKKRTEEPENREIGESENWRDGESAKEQITEKPSLRKKVHVDKSNYKPLLKLLTENTNQFELNNDPPESWLPKYITEKKDALNKIDNVSNNLERINNQLELVGVINSTKGQGAAILKNKSNNKIEVIKKGEQYLGLELLEIKSNEVVLGNKSLNKTYIKKIVANN